MKLVEEDFAELRREGNVSAVCPLEFITCECNRFPCITRRVPIIRQEDGGGGEERARERAPLKLQTIDCRIGIIDVFEYSDEFCAVPLIR